MTGMLKGMVLALAALGLFGLSILAFLHLSGRLDEEGIRDLPMVGRFLEQEDPPLEDGTVGLAEASATQDGGGDGEDGGRQAKAAVEADRLQRRAIFDFKGFEALDPPTSREEIVEFYRLGKEASDKLAQREAQLERRRYELDLLEADLEERRVTLDKLMNRIRSEKEKVQAAYDSFQASWVEMKKSEAPRFKKNATILANMEPKKASEFLLEMVPTKEDEAVNYLTYMEPAAASEILSQMDPDKGANLILKATRLIQKND